MCGFAGIGRTEPRGVEYADDLHLASEVEAFRARHQLEPGRCTTWRHGQLVTRRYYRADFPGASPAADREYDRSRVDALIHDLIRLWMRPDVTVGGYLGGGLDECAFEAIVSDERWTVHRARSVSGGEIADVLPTVVWYIETSVVRTAPAPLFLKAGVPDDPLFWHMPGFGLTSWIKEFGMGDVRDSVADWDAIDELRDSPSPGLRGCSHSSRVAWREIETLRASYLHCSLGDPAGDGTWHGSRGPLPGPSFVRACGVR